jgi:hypothetical protein
VVVLGVWSAGDSLEEKFESARGFYAVSFECRRRPGKTLQGFHKALGRLPLPVFRAFARGVERMIFKVFGDRLLVDGFLPIGCDGSRLECPRSAELEQHLPRSSKEGSAPTLWVTAMVHLRLGLLLRWRLGLGNASEQHHLLRMLIGLPRTAILVADAAYFGYALANAIDKQPLHFLLRVCSKSDFYTLAAVSLDDFVEGIVYYWPKSARLQGLPPLKVRLLRVRDRRHDVWLVTNVLESDRLSLETAAKFYRWRWKNEGLFRSYKRTLHKVKLQCRTVKLVHRELEGSLLAIQLLLAQTTLTIVENWKPSKRTPEPPLASVRKGVLEIRREMRWAGSLKRRPSFQRRLSRATCDRRARTTPK